MRGSSRRALASLLSQRKVAVRTKGCPVNAVLLEIRAPPPGAHPIRKWILPPWGVLRQTPDESTSASWHASSHASISGRYSHSLRPGGCSASIAEARPSPLRYESRHDRVSRSFPDHGGRDERDLTARTREPRPGAHTRANLRLMCPAGTPPSSLAQSATSARHAAKSAGVAAQPRRASHPQAATTAVPHARHGRVGDSGGYGIAAVITNAGPEKGNAPGIRAILDGRVPLGRRRRSASLDSWRAEALASRLRRAVKLSDQEGCK